MILIRIELVWHKNEWFSFFVKCMFCFSFLNHLENYGSWILLYCMLSIPKGQKEKVNFLMAWDRIVSYQYRFVSIGIVSYHNKIKVHIPNCDRNMIDLQQILLIHFCLTAIDAFSNQDINHNCTRITSCNTSYDNSVWLW